MIFTSLDDREFVRYLRGAYKDGGPDYHQEAIRRIEHLVSEIDALEYEINSLEDKLHACNTRGQSQEQRQEAA